MVISTLETVDEKQIEESRLFRIKSDFDGILAHCALSRGTVGLVGNCLHSLVPMMAVPDGNESNW